MQYDTRPLHLGYADFRYLLAQLGPSLGLWRAAEIAALREQAGLLTAPVLDLGCGDGFVTAQVMREVAIGLDPDGAALDRAAGRGLYRQFVSAPVEEAALPAGSVGSILSNSVLEHLPRIDDALAAANRALRPGGYLVLTVPSEAFSRWLALPGARYAAGRNRHFQHLNLWTAEAWADRLGKAGFAVETVRPYLRPGWVRAWDFLELLQMPQVGRRRLFGAAWRGMPAAWLDALARRAAGWDLSAPPPGGGRLIAARKVQSG